MVWRCPEYVADGNAALHIVYVLRWLSRRNDIPWFFV